MRIISPLLKHVVYPGLAHAGYLKRSPDGGPVVITYHGVLPPNYDSIDSGLDASLVSIEALRAQLVLLSRGYKFVSPQQYLDWRMGTASLPENAVLLTCDDGLQNVDLMLPLLHEAGAKCLFFITGRSVGNKPAMLWHEELYLILLRVKQTLRVSLPNGKTALIVPSKSRELWWNFVENLSALGEVERSNFIGRLQQQAEIDAEWRQDFLKSPGMRDRFLVLNENGVRRLLIAGHTVGAHSMSHLVLSRASDELAWFEIRESHDALERLTGQQIWTFAYPFGNPSSVSDREVRFAERAGFHCAFLNIEDGRGGGHYAVPRVHVTGQMGLAEFEAHVSGVHSQLRRGFWQQAGA
jgi:peptidoglycan/xylan/chitin deacetylase (PgdA/CDA1 family)